MKRLGSEAAEELGEDHGFRKESPVEQRMEIDRQLTFVPRPPSVKEKLPSPYGRNHARGPKIAPIVHKGRFLINNLSLRIFLISNLEQKIMTGSKTCLLYLTQFVNNQLDIFFIWHTFTIKAQLTIIFITSSKVFLDLELNPIDLELISFLNRVVNYVNCNKDEYFTIGHNGVCHFCAGEEIEYTSLDRWEQEYKLYLKLIKVQTLKIEFIVK